MERVCLLLAVIGFVLPYYVFLAFLGEFGLDLPELIGQPFANDISTFFAVDVIIAALAVLAFSYCESRRLRIASWWITLLSTLLVGPGFALPLFLYRAGKQDGHPPNGAEAPQQ